MKDLGTTTARAALKPVVILLLGTMLLLKYLQSLRWSAVGKTARKWLTLRFEATEVRRKTS